MDNDKRKMKTLRCKVSVEELDAIRSAAVASKLTVSTYLRLSGLKSTVRPVVIDPIAREQWVALSRVASNLNQITHHLNEGRVVDPKLIEEALMATRCALLQARPPIVKVSSSL